MSDDQNAPTEGGTEGLKDFVALTDVPKPGAAPKLLLVVTMTGDVLVRDAEAAADAWDRAAELLKAFTAAVLAGVKAEVPDISLVFPILAGRIAQLEAELAGVRRFH